jgi:hypothetical protein
MSIYWCFALLLLSHLLKFDLQMHRRQVLLDAARKVGIEGAEELLEDPSKGVDEVWFQLSLSLRTYYSY